MSSPSPIAPPGAAASLRGPAAQQAQARAAGAAAPSRSPPPVFSTSNRERLQALGLCGGVDPFDTPQWEAGGAFDALHRGLP